MACKPRSVHAKFHTRDLPSRDGAWRGFAWPRLAPPSAPTPGAYRACRRLQGYGGSQKCEHDSIRSKCKECLWSTPAYAPTSASKACARNAADRRYASMTAKEASVRSAWDRACRLWSCWPHQFLISRGPGHSASFRRRGWHGGMHLFTVIILPERRTDARRHLCRLRNLRQEAGLFFPARRELRAHNLRRGSGVTTPSRDVRALTPWQGWNDVH